MFLMTIQCGVAFKVTPEMILKITGEGGIMMTTSFNLSLYDFILTADI